MQICVLAAAIVSCLVTIFYIPAARATAYYNNYDYANFALVYARSFVFLQADAIVSHIYCNLANSL